MIRRLIIAILVSITVVAQQAPAVTPGSAAVAPSELVNAVVSNEFNDRVQHRKWMYLIEKRDGTQSLTEEQVETRNGPLYRVLALNGTPLTPEQRQQDDDRIRRLLSDSGQQSKLKQLYEGDEEKLERLMRVMPKAFLYDYDGVEGKFVRLKFRPDPNYKPPDYESRVVHSLAGTVLIDPQQRRLAKLSGRLINRVDFGYGLFGHIDEGGTFEIERVQVAPIQWKTSLLSIHLSGRMILFKTVNKQQFEVRSKFREVPPDLTLPQAKDLLLSNSSTAPTRGAASLQLPQH